VAWIPALSSIAYPSTVPSSKPKTKSSTVGYKKNPCLRPWYCRWVFIYWAIILGLIVYMVLIQPSKRIPLDAIIPGEPATGRPVLLWWMREDGTLTAESALLTDYSGLLPYSLTGSPVPYIVYSGYIGYTEGLIEGGSK